MDAPQRLARLYAALPAEAPEAQRPALVDAALRHLGLARAAGAERPERWVDDPGFATIKGDARFAEVAKPR
jgi:hypothetical protein